MIYEQNINEEPLEIPFHKMNLENLIPKMRVKRANTENILKSQREKIKIIKDRIKTSKTKDPKHSKEK